MRPAVSTSGRVGAGDAVVPAFPSGMWDHPIFRRWSQSLRARTQSGRRPLWFHLLILAFGLAFSLSAVGAVAFFAASREDSADNKRMRLSNALEKLRSGYAKSTADRAREISQAISSLGRFSLKIKSALAPAGTLRYRHRRAWLMSEDGSLIATHPTDDRPLPSPLRSLADEFSAERVQAPGSVPIQPQDGRAAAPAETDILIVNGRPGLAAVTTVSPDVGLIDALDRSLVLATFVPFDEHLVRLLAQDARVPGLKLETEPSASKGPLTFQTNRHGRIAAWFTWTSEHSLWESIERNWPLFGIGGLSFLALGGFSLNQMERTARALKASEQRVWRTAQEDPLTHMPNRGRIIELLYEALALRPSGQAVVFTCFNLDGFKEVNEILGHAAGDQLLVAAAARLHEAMPGGASLGRIGGDEFAMVMGAKDAAAAMEAANACARALSLPFVIHGRTVGISASIGLAQAPEDGDSGSELIRRADLAARAAKKGGRGRILAFHLGLEAEINERRFMERELRRALAEKRLSVAYQPIVAGDGLRVIGVEALARWQHATRGDIPPGLFVSVAEQTGLMTELGHFVLRRALADAGAWPGLYVAINLSPVQVRDRGLVRLVDQALADTKIDPTRVVLEITEGMLIDNPEEAKQRLKELRALGVKIALDDFGSGYSSLNYLRRLPIDKLKIDKEFVAPLGRSANGGVIVQAIVALGRALGLSVLAEGVETEEQRVLLRLAGCDELQGFLFARPMPLPALTEFLSQAPKVDQA